MIQKAIKTINSEMRKRPDDRRLEILGQYLIDRCRDEGTAAALLARGKSLTGCLRALEQEAEKQITRRQGTVVVSMEGAEVLRLAARYYGLEEQEIPDEPVPSPAPSALPSLDDFL